MSAVAPRKILEPASPTTNETVYNIVDSIQQAVFHSL
jgi:hypothetical protein